MKTTKTIITAFALCTLCAEAKAQTMTVADVEAVPGETVEFVLNLANGKADTYTAMQFDVQFPPTGFATTGDYIVSKDWKNATAIIGSVDANGVATIPVASSETITPADVNGLLSVSFTVGSEVALGDYNVTLSNIWFGYGTNSKDYLDNVAFTVHVVAAHNIVLDENATGMPASAKNMNVRVVRTIEAGEWNTICLPFSMTAEQVKSAFGSDVQLGDFTGWSSEENDGVIVAINVEFTSVSAIEANHPYVIKVSAPVTEFSVAGVDIDPEEEPVVQVGKRMAERGYMYGTYVVKTVPEENIYLNQSKFWYSKGTTQTKGMTGYFEFRDVLDAYYDETEYSSQIKMILDDQTTGVSDISHKAAVSESYYDLQGRRMEKPVKKGLYIWGAKKVIK